MTLPPESLTVPTIVDPAVNETMVSESAIAALAGVPVKVTVWLPNLTPAADV